MQTHLLLPLASSLLYVGGALAVKRAVELGAGLWWTNVVANIVIFLFFLPMLLLGGPGQPFVAAWQPAVVGLLMLGGQALAILALSRGDVSVATPVLGVKTVLVAIFTTWVLVQPVPAPLWIGAVLSALAIVMLQRRGQRGESPGLPTEPAIGGIPAGHRAVRHHHVGFTIAMGIAAAACFALFDVCIQKWSSLWGAWLFLPLVSGAAVVYSIALMPVFGRGRGPTPRRAWPWLLMGTGLMAVQGVVLITAIAIYGDATAVNIVYSSRGLWSVIAVWLVGHWFANRERHLGAAVLGWRLVGAALMTAAIVLALV
jgi:drug/metabolite transporter (DMT)-like permease